MKKLIAALVLFLGACGPLSGNRPVVNSVMNQIGIGQRGDDAPPAQAAQPLSRAMIEAAGRDLIALTIGESPAVFVAGRIATNGSMTTWALPSEQTLSLRRGILVATRGFGDDLMGADTAEVSAAIRARGGRVTRVMDFMTGTDQIERRTFICDITPILEERITIFERSYAAIRFSERCQSQSIAFENLYWSDRAGTVLQSRQWVSPSVGFMEIQAL